jgi:hypothetical protein
MPSGTVEEEPSQVGHHKVAQHILDALAMGLIVEV